MSNEPQKYFRKTFFFGIAALTGWVFLAAPAGANIPGGGTGTGANVTVTDNNDGTVTMANGVVSIHIYKSGASINQINYTYNNGSGTQTQNLLAGGKNGGTFYWEFGGWGGNPWIYSLVTNNGSYAEVHMYSDSATNGLVDVHFSMLRGSPGFYATPIWSHRPQDGTFGTGEERDNIYLAPYFNWMSVNDQVQRETGLNATYTGAFYSPQENSLCTSGVLQGTYDDKYKWSTDFGVEHVWGWSSVSDPAIGLVGKNVGIWHVVASSEFYNGGPLKSELNDAPMVNMINGGHYYMGNDSGFAAGESWTRVSGPYFIYVNNVSNTLTDPVQTSQALYADARAQADAEISAWPYSWMNNPNYASATQRGTVTGKIVINDSYNPSAAASNLWVGVVRQPITGNGVYDFQMWMKPYQFWVQSDAAGNFTIPDVIATNNYTLYAFGPGAAGTFMSQNQTGGNPPLLYNLASPQFSITVTGGATNNLGVVTWTPARVGPTVFEIGYPTRKGDKFRHGDDYWVGDIGPSPTAPSPVWTKFLEFPFDYPNGLNYVVGQNRWNTDWNFIQSVYPDYNANNIVSSSTISFTLSNSPAGATASLYLGIASDDNSPIYVTVNGTLLVSGNATGTPNNNLLNTGWYPSYAGSDTNIREENHAPFSDERLNFSGSLLHSGSLPNTINISFRQAGGSSFFHHLIYDYLRLELTGYVPPAPLGVTAYPGNNSVLLGWPATPGATSYNILRSTVSGSGYVSLTNGVGGPVCGSGPSNATFVDGTAANGTTYYYVVQSVNPVNHSGNSPQSSGVTPSAGLLSTVPAAPAGLAVGSVSNAVTLNWAAAAGANFYTIQRGTVLNKLGYVPFYTTLNNTTAGTTYTDASGTLGCTYSYLVSATSAGGTSSNSLAVIAKPVPPPPATAPANVRITDTITSSNQTAKITWSPVNGAVGYILYRASNPAGPFSFPGNYIQSMMTTNYTDGGLAANTLYSYMVIAMNAGGISTNSMVVSTPPAAPVNLHAYPANAQITLTWTTSVGATNYVIKRSTSSGAETTFATTGSTSFTDTNVLNGTTYYYLVIAVDNGGNSLNSAEASATPSLAANSPLVWSGAVNANWNINTTANWTSNGVASLYQDGSAVQFDDTAVGSPAVTVAAAVSPASVLFNNSAKNYTLSGSAIAGATGISKSGSGNLTLAAANTFTGNITVDDGTLFASTGTAANPPVSGSLGNPGLAGRTVTINDGANVTISAANLMGKPQYNGNQPAFVITGGTLSTVTGAVANQIGNVTLNGGTVTAGITSTATGGGLNYSKGLNAYLSFQLHNNVTVIGSVPSFMLGNGAAFTSAQDGFSLATVSTFNVADVTGDSNADLTVTAAFGDRNYDNSGQGTGSVVKTGAGTMVLSGLNFYSGGTTVSAGTLVAGISDNQPLAATTGNVFAGLANAAGPFGKPTTVVTLGDAATTSGNASPSLLIGGPFTVGHPLTIANQPTTGTYTIGGGTDDNAAFTNLITVNQPLTIAEVANADTNVLTISGGIASGSAGNKPITFAGPGNVKVMTAAIANGSGTVAVNVTGGFTTFTPASTYSGGTLVTNGTLEVDNASGSGTGPGAVTVANGGNLAGNGIISGAVTVQTGGTFAAGVAAGGLGVFTLNNNLTLVPGSTTFAQVQHAPLTNDVVKVLGTLTEGGTLSVANFGATILAAGDSFKLFNATSYAGSFSSFVLPALPADLVWNTSRLNVDGSLWVVSTLPPVVDQIGLVGNNLIFTGTGGTPNWSYYLLTTTNLALPTAQWARVATNGFDGSGNFSLTVTNALTSGSAQGFYLLQLP